MDGSVERVYYTDAFPNHPRSGINFMTVEDKHYLFTNIGNTIYTLIYQAGGEDIQPQEFKI